MTAIGSIITRHNAPDLLAGNEAQPAADGVFADTLRMLFQRNAVGMEFGGNGRDPSAASMFNEHGFFAHAPVPLPASHQYPASEPVVTLSQDSIDGSSVATSGLDGLSDTSANPHSVQVQAFRSPNAADQPASSATERQMYVEQAKPDAGLDAVGSSASPIQLPVRQIKAASSNNITDVQAIDRGVNRTTAVPKPEIMLAVAAEGRRMSISARCGALTGGGIEELQEEVIKLLARYGFSLDELRVNGGYPGIREGEN